ncbi:MAG: Molybdopterin synthase sulfur carrier subunit / Molybdopterin synthase catalytic subunit MoaE [uncultured Sphingomonas sp.]|uniref:Molybdopterin synthase sulfur carrier subunit n=1 Tax=uncultured Sphingomonas sp. TaxID=158754 RepID=A0A6J4SBE6_9SPHN|nr:molybdopterin converting factor subunit 1 [uncultured Sphingomonas sp.]CAA9494856.1 MAG: Molybdopterin synthase sulfur carrier subunit / Molybdopterin synthase catalytic subunit MoaE [uncultured Sphingomonas sp.]
MRVRLLCFGRLTEARSEREATIELADGVDDTAALRAWLARDHPGFAQPSVRIALNGEVVTGDRPLVDGDEVAFMPPVSGG